MISGSADQALDSVINVDMEWLQHFYAGLTKPPDPSRSSSAMDDDMEMELINIINNANKRSRMIAAPATNTNRMGSCYLAAGMKSELDICRIAASLISSAEATSVTTRAASRTSCGMIINDLSTAANTSADLLKYSSALPSGLAAAPAVTAGGMGRGSGAVKVKKKRVRPSRRVPTTVVKTDTSNFKAMVEHFTGIPTTTTTTTQESTTSHSVPSSSPQSTSSPSSPSFSKPLPHPAVCKISSSLSTAPNPNTSAATASCPSPLMPSPFPTSQSPPQLPSISTVGSVISSGDIPNSADPEELAMSLIDPVFLDELWS